MQCANCQGRWWTPLFYSLMLDISDVIYATDVKFIFLKSACKQWNATQIKDCYGFPPVGFIGC